MAYWDVKDKKENKKTEKEEAENKETKNGDTENRESTSSEGEKPTEDPAAEGNIAEENNTEKNTAERNTAEENVTEKNTEEGNTAGNNTAEENADKQYPRGRGLYRYVKISLSTLNKLIVVLCVVLVVCIALGLRNRGYQVDFETLGGTQVESQELMYGDLIDPPEEPYREGYTFTGWYRNADAEEEWNLETDLVDGDMTLYAGWEENP